jgi:hypothetical protein
LKIYNYLYKLSISILYNLLTNLIKENIMKKAIVLIALFAATFAFASEAAPAAETNTTEAAH